MNFLKSIFFLSFVIITSCTDNSTSPVSGILAFKYSINLQISEPSGLSISKNNETFWIVGDGNNIVYQTSLSGKVIHQFEVAGEDLEGITTINDSLVAITLEERREVLIISNSGILERRLKINVSGPFNNGLEGITYLSKENNLLLANEKNPTSLIKVDLLGNIISNDTVSFAEDLAGLYYDEIEDVVWIASQQSHKIFKCTNNYKILEEFAVPDEKYEGITIKNDSIFVVSDKFDKLTCFSITE